MVLFTYVVPFMTPNIKPPLDLLAFRKDLGCLKLIRNPSYRQRFSFDKFTNVNIKEDEWRYSIEFTDLTAIGNMSTITVYKRDYLHLGIQSVTLFAPPGTSLELQSYQEQSFYR
jgi:hypothetical protein